MSKVLVPAVVEYAVYKCPNCYSGSMKQIWSHEVGLPPVQTSNPPEYEHFCPECGYTEVLNEIYPHYEIRLEHLVLGTNPIKVI